MSSTTVVVALLILVIAGVVWAVSPPQVGTLVSTVIALIAVLYVVLNVSFG